MVRAYRVLYASYYVVVVSAKYIQLNIIISRLLTFSIVNHHTV